MMKNVPRVRDAVDHFVAIKNITKVTVNYLVIPTTIKVARNLVSENSAVPEETDNIMSAVIQTLILLHQPQLQSTVMVSFRGIWGGETSIVKYVTPLQIFINFQAMVTRDMGTHTRKRVKQSLI